MFDWKKFSNDPCCVKTHNTWNKYYNQNIVKFNIFEAKKREHYLIDLCINNFDHVKLLDVGFGEHVLENLDSEIWFHRLLRNLPGHNIHGLDINEELVNSISSFTNYNNLHIGSACDKELLIDDGNFDVIHAGDVIEHVGNLSDFFVFCSNNLKPFGRLVITTPNPCAENVKKSILETCSINANMEHTCWITPSNINELCRRHGFLFAESHYVMNKRKSLKNIFREKYIFAKKDIYFGEFIFLLIKNNN